MTALIETLPKPPYGAPCNSCGLCCIWEQCPLSEAFFGPRKLCPALERGQEGALVCGLVRNPLAYTNTPRWSEEALREAFSLLIGSGAGCDAPTTEAENSDLGTKARMFAHAEESVRTASPDARMLVNFLTGIER